MSEVVLLSTDVGGLTEALDRGARLRREGVAFDVALRFPDDRSTVANLAARDVVAAELDPARRTAALDALGAHDARLGRAMLEDLSTVGRPQREVARDLLALARAARVSSWAQSRRLTLGLDMTVRRVLAVPSDPFVPRPPLPPPPGDRILLWAPLQRTDTMLLALAGACADGAPVDVVCAGGERHGYDVTLVPLADAAAALARAGVVVALDTDDPGAAVALAAWQRPLCAPSTSGANLWLRGLTTYRAWSRGDLTLAVAIARGLPPPVPGVLPATSANDATGASDATGTSGASGASDGPFANGPVVRVVVRADGEMPCALTAGALSRLRYASVEVVVARGDAAAADAARAEGAAYVLALEDGDVPYPDAVARLVAALERSGEDVARGDALVTYLVDAPGPAVVLGHAAVGPHAPAENARDGLPLRTLVRRTRLVAGDADGALAVRVDAVLGTAHRYLDGRSAFRRSAPARPSRLPALRLDPPRPLAAD